MPEGNRKGDIDFQDFTYDGVRKDGLLYEGLGQLTDGDYGQDNFRLKGKGIRGETIKVLLSGVHMTMYIDVQR